MRHALIISLLWAYSSIGFAQNILPLSARDASLGGADIASFTSNSLSGNPATSASDSAKPLYLFASYAPERQNIPSANQLSAGFAYYSHLTSSSFSIGFSRLAYEEIYSDQVATFTANHRFDLDSGRSASVGLQIRYESVAFTPSYPTVHFFIADLGLRFALTKEFSIGADAMNILGSNITLESGEKEEIRRTFDIGIAFSPHETGVSLFTALRKETNADLVAGFGIEYFPINALAIRAGTTSEFNSISGGFGLQYNILIFDLSAKYVTDLGTSLIFSIAAAW